MKRIFARSWAPDPGAGRPAGRAPAWLLPAALVLAAAAPSPVRAEAIAWRDWNDDAFEEAARARRPILLYLTASWCHWCRVMDRDVYPDSLVTALVNERFVPVRVDRDLRPDIDRRYNAGGWPSTVFLSPGGELIKGQTFLQRELLAQLLNEVSHYYRNNHQAFEARVSAFRAGAKEREAAAAVADSAGRVLEEGIVREVAGRMFAPGTTDPLYGGFGKSAKFPLPSELRFALEARGHGAGEEPARFAAMTLAAMRRGAIWDRLEGGFHRYSTRPDWNAPEYEKLLRPNAELAAVYLRAHADTGDESFRETALATLAYLDRRLYDRARGLYRGSEDAGLVTGRRGSYYEWTAHELGQCVPPRSAALLAALFGFDEGERDRSRPLYEARSQAEAAKRARLDPAAAERALEEGLEGLRRARARRNGPLVSRELPVDGNCRAALAFLAAAESAAPDDSTRAAWRAHAREVAERLMASGCDPAATVPHWTGVPAGAPRLLDDQLAFAELLLALYGDTGDAAWLDRARDASRTLLRAFAHEGHGALADRVRDGVAEHGLLANMVWDIETNGRAARHLLAVDRAGDRREFRPAVAKVLRFFLPDLPSYGMFAGDFALAAAEFLDVPAAGGVDSPGGAR